MPRRAARYSAPKAPSDPVICHTCPILTCVSFLLSCARARSVSAMSKDRGATIIIWPPLPAYAMQGRGETPKAAGVQNANSPMVLSGVGEKVIARFCGKGGSETHQTRCSKLVRRDRSVVHTPGQLVARTAGHRRTRVHAIFVAACGKSCQRYWSPSASSFANGRPRAGRAGTGPAHRTAAKRAASSCTTPVQAPGSSRVLTVDHTPPSRQPAVDVSTRGF